MRERPDLANLKQQAKQLLRAFEAGETSAIEEVNVHYNGAKRGAFALHDAQLVLARSYGFESWPKLKAFVDGVTIRQLAASVREGKLERVQKMLRARPELSNMAMSYCDEHRAIHYAVMARQLKMVRLLMRSGADARAGIHPHRDATSAWTVAQERGFTEIVAAIEEEEKRRTKPEAIQAEKVGTEDPAREAVRRGDLTWLRARQRDGALLNNIDWREGGLLTEAVESEQLEVLAYLLEAGFDPNEHTTSGSGDWTAHSQGYPLWQAAALGREDIMRLLLDHGADPNVHVDSSGSAVYSAYSHKQWAAAELLRARGGRVTTDIASIYRQTEVARQLLAADVSVAEEMLFRAAGAGATEIVRLALEHIDWPRDDVRWLKPLSEPLSFWHHIPWLYAGNKEFDREGYFDCFRMVLERCDANVTDGSGRMILHEIAAMGEWVTEAEVGLFATAALEAGARTNQRDDTLQSTPLGWACRWGRVQMVKLLIEYGADVEELAAEPWARPRAWAEKKGHQGILSALG